MSKYRNNTNISRGLLWGMGATGVAFVLVKIFHVVNGIQNLNEFQKNEYANHSSTWVVVKDSVTGKLDTVLLSEYLEKQREASMINVKDTAAPK
jgi:hypothetical protein